MNFELKTRIPILGWRIAVALFFSAFITQNSAFPQSTLAGTGTISGAGTTKTAASTARYFNGTSSDYLSHADNASLDSPSTAITVAAWITLAASQTSYAKIVYKQIQASPSEPVASYVIYGNSDSVRGFISSTGGGMYTGSVTGLAQSTWYFVVMRWDNTVAPRIDVYNHDSTLFGSGPGPENYGGTLGYDNYPLFIGNNHNQTLGWNGNIAQVYIDNTSLSDADVQTLLHGTQPHAASAGYWPLGLGSPEPDQSGHGNDLTVTGTTIMPGP